MTAIDTLLYAKQATIALASPLFWTLNMSIPNEIGCDSYSTSQANTLLNAKQNTLTAAGSGGDIPMLTGSTIKALAPGSGVSLSDNATTKVVTLSFDRSIILTSSQLTKTDNGNGSLTLALASNLENINTDNISAADINGDTIYASVQVNTNTIGAKDRNSTRLNSSHIPLSRMPSSA